jgi:Sec-independent protein translocase protein TatA
MVIRLASSTSGKMVMFAEHAHVLFGWIGKECTAHGVFTREQLPEAIARLRRGMDEEKQAIERQALEQAQEAREEQRNDGDGKEAEGEERRPDEIVTLAQRAQPLIRLMERTLKEDGFILWEASGDF